MHRKKTISGGCISKHTCRWLLRAHENQEQMQDSFMGVLLTHRQCTTHSYAPATHHSPIGRFLIVLFMVLIMITAHHEVGVDGHHDPDGFMIVIMVLDDSKVLYSICSPFDGADSGMTVQPQHQKTSPARAVRQAQ